MTNQLYPPISHNKHLMAQWSHKKNIGIDPDKTSSHSAKKYWWKCAFGHEWQASTDSRSRGTGCPYCSNRKIDPKNSLAALFPKVARQWHATYNKPLMPNQVAPKSAKKVWWSCNNGHEWQAVIHVRTKGNNCPKCRDEEWAKKRKQKEARRRPIRLLRLERPDLINEFDKSKNDGLDLDKVTVGSKNKAWWICKRGHNWQTSIDTRRSGAGCPICGNQSSKREIRLLTELQSVFGADAIKWRKKIDRDECDLMLPEYKLAIEYDGYFWHRNKQVKDIQKSRNLQAKGIDLIRIREHPLKDIGLNCISVNQKISNEFTLIKALLEKIQNLRTLSPKHNQSVKNYLKQKSLAADSTYQEYIASLPGPLPGKSLLDLQPIYASEWNYEKNAPLSPDLFSEKSGAKVWWKCSKGHEWESVIATRVSQDQKCPYCRGMKASSGHSLANSNPTLTAEWHPTLNKGMSPHEITPNSSKVIWWKCSKGHEWQATINNRVRKKTRCPFCSQRKASSFHNLAVINPKLAAEWNYKKNAGLIPSEVTPRSSKKVWWKCKNGHEWESTVANRSGGKGCRFCAGRKS